MLNSHIIRLPNSGWQYFSILWEGTWHKNQSPSIAQWTMVPPLNSSKILCTKILIQCFKSFFLWFSKIAKHCLHVWLLYCCSVLQRCFWCLVWLLLRVAEAASFNFGEKCWSLKVCVSCHTSHQKNVTCQYEPWPEKNCKGILNDCWGNILL